MIDYSSMVKVRDGVITREPVPGFLTASQIPIADIADLTWLGLPDYVGYGWWPIEDQSVALSQYQNYGEETLTIDADNKVVLSSRPVINWTASEILTYKAGIDRHISKLAFRNRFTLAEKIAFEMAQVDDPAATLTVRQVAAGLRVMEKDLNVGQYVDLNAAETQAGLHQLEELSIIAAGRADEIIWGDISAIEMP